MPIYRSTEVALSFLAMVWGSILMAPGNLFAGIARYELLGRYAPDTVWGAVMFVCGLGIFIARPHWWRAQCHAALCIVWLGMTILSLLSTITPPAVLIASLLLTIAAVHAFKNWRLTHPTKGQP